MVYQYIAYRVVYINTTTSDYILLLVLCFTHNFVMRESKHLELLVTFVNLRVTIYVRICMYVHNKYIY